MIEPNVASFGRSNHLLRWTLEEGLLDEEREAAHNEQHPLVYLAQQASSWDWLSSEGLSAP